jgi:hypothetical protein
MEQNAAAVNRRAKPGLGADSRPARCQTILVASGGAEGDQQSLFRVVARCQAHRLAFSADEQDFGAVGLKDNLAVFIQV